MINFWYFLVDLEMNNAENIHVRCTCSTNVYLNKRCVAVHFVPNFHAKYLWAECFEILHNEFIGFHSPLFTSYLMSEKCHTQVVTGKSQMYLSVFLNALMKILKYERFSCVSDSSKVLIFFNTSLDNVFFMLPMGSAESSFNRFFFAS